MSSKANSTILLIGIGNLLRGDDAVGRIAAQHLRQRSVPALRVLEHDGEGASLMEVWKSEQTVIVIDAISSRRKPGTIHRFDVTRHPLQKRILHSSTHAFGLHEAIQLAKSLQQLPGRLIVYGIEVQSSAIGTPLSAVVENAVPRLVDRIVREVELQSGTSELRDPQPQSGGRRSAASWSLKSRLKGPR